MSKPLITVEELEMIEERVNEILENGDEPRTEYEQLLQVTYLAAVLGERLEDITKVLGIHLLDFDTYAWFHLVIGYSLGEKERSKFEDKVNHKPETNKVH